MGFSAEGELGEGDGVLGVGVVVVVLRRSVGAVVEEEGAAGHAVAGPVVDGAFVVGVRAGDVGAVGVVVECAGWEVGELGALLFGCWGGSGEGWGWG